MVGQVLLRAFNSWAELVGEKKRLNTTAQRVMARFLKADLIAAWNSWCETVETMKVLSRLIKRMLLQQLSGLFDQWCDWIVGEKSSRHKLRTLIIRMQQVAVSSAFRTWVDGIRDAKHQAVIDAYEEKAAVARELVLSRLLDRKLQQKGVRVLVAWCAYTKKAMRYSVIIERSDEARERKAQKVGFNDWVRSHVHKSLPVISGTYTSAEDLNQAMIKGSKMFIQMLNLHTENEASLERSIAEARSTVESLETELNDQRILVENRSSRLGWAEEQIERDTETIRHLTQRLHVAETRIAEADEQTVAMVDELKVLVARKRAEQDERDEAHADENVGLQRELSRLQRVADEAEYRRQDETARAREAEVLATSALAVGEERGEKEIAALRQGLQQAEQMLAASRSSEVVEAEYQRAFEHARVMEEQNGQSERRVTELTSGLNALKRQHATLKAENADLKLVVATEQRANTVLNTSRRDAAFETAGLEEQVSSTAEMMKQMQQQLRNSEEVRETLLEQLDRGRHSEARAKAEAERTVLLESRLKQAQELLRMTNEEKAALGTNLSAATGQLRTQTANEQAARVEMERRMSEQLLVVRTDMEAQTRVELDTMASKNAELRKELAELTRNSASAMHMSRKAAEQAVGQVAQGAATTTASLRAQLDEARRAADQERAEAARQTRVGELSASAERDELSHKLADAEQAAEEAENQLGSVRARLDTAEDDLGLARNEAAIAAARAEHAGAQLAQGLRERDVELARLRTQLDATASVEGIRSDAADEMVTAREILLRRTEEAESQLAEERRLWEQTMADLEYKSEREKSVAEAALTRQDELAAEHLRRQDKLAAEHGESKQTLIEWVAQLESSAEERAAEIARLRNANERTKVRTVYTGPPV